MASTDKNSSNVYDSKGNDVTGTFESILTNKKGEERWNFLI